MLMVSKFIWLSLFSKVSVFFFKWTKSFSWAQLFLLTGFTSKMIQVCVIFNGHAACQNFQKLQQQVSPSKLGTRGCLFSSDSLSLSQKKPANFTTNTGYTWLFIRLSCGGWCNFWNTHRAEKPKQILQQISPSTLCTRFHQTLMGLMQLLKHTQWIKGKRYYSKFHRQHWVHVAACFHQTLSWLMMQLLKHTQRAEKPKQILQQISPSTLGTRGCLFSLHQALMVDDETFFGYWIQT